MKAEEMRDVKKRERKKEKHLTGSLSSIAQYRAHNLGKRERSRGKTQQSWRTRRESDNSHGTCMYSTTKRRGKDERI